MTKKVTLDQEGSMSPDQFIRKVKSKIFLTNLLPSPNSNFKIIKLINVSTVIKTSLSNF